MLPLAGKLFNEADLSVSWSEPFLLQPSHRRSRDQNIPRATHQHVSRDCCFFFFSFLSLLPYPPSHFHSPPPCVSLQKCATRSLHPESLKTRTIYQSHPIFLLALLSRCTPLRDQNSSMPGILPLTGVHRRSLTHQTRHLALLEASPLTFEMIPCPLARCTNWPDLPLSMSERFLF